MTDEEVKNYQNMMSQGMRNIAPRESPCYEVYFDIGDRVQLKGGGYTMTIASDTTPIGMVECQWFKDGYIAAAVFHQKALKRVRWWHIFA